MAFYIGYDQRPLYKSKTLTVISKSSKRCKALDSFQILLFTSIGHKLKTHTAWKHASSALIVSIEASYGWICKNKRIPKRPIYDKTNYGSSKSSSRICLRTLGKTLPRRNQVFPLPNAPSSTCSIRCLQLFEVSLRMELCDETLPSTFALHLGIGFSLFPIELWLKTPIGNLLVCYI